MKNIICIIGLPGSGKTTYANNFKEYFLFDDMSMNISMLPVAQEHQNIVITDPYMCVVSKERIISKITEYFGESDITFYAFENDPDKAIKNNSLRSDKIVSDIFIKHLSSKYDPYQYENILKVW